MSGTPVPSLNIRELNSGLSTTPNVGEGITMKLGTASAGAYNKPVRCSTQPSINAYGVGPLVSSAGPHQAYSGQTQFLCRTFASIPGTFGAVTKSPVTSPTSPSTLALSAATFSARADGNPVPGGAALNLTTGFTLPPSPLPLKIVIGAGGVAHTVTISYYDVESVQRTTIVSVSGVGTFTTAANVDLKSIISYTTSVDPVGTTTLTWDYAGPLDRFAQLKWQVTRGGQINVTGAQAPIVRYSFDNGTTYSPGFQIPTTGILDVYTYPGGLTSWHTGIRCTFTQGTVASALYGAVRAAGATVNGDTIWTLGASGATAEIEVKTVAAALAFTVVGSAVKLTAHTTGGTAASYNAFGGQLAGVTFAVGTVGTGGNAITIATVNDGGTGNVTVVGNAITIHYTTGVTTVANVKASFPVAVTFGSVTATGGTNANILADPGDTHAATNLAGGLNATLVSTGQDIVDFFDTDTSAGTLQARQLIHSIGIVGTGLGLTAAMVATGAANGGIAWTALKPGVRVRHVVAGNNTTETIQVAGLDVTIISATDADGAETSTANSILATLALSAHADAQALLSGVATGTGAGIIGSWATYVSLLMAMEAGDEWTSYTTPPQSSVADFQTAWNALKTNFKKTLGNIEHVHLVQDNCDNVTYQNFVTWLQSVKQDLKLPLWGTVQGLYNLPATYASEAAWATAYISALPSPRNDSGLVDLEGGEEDVIVALYGSQLVMNVATLNVARCMNVVISQSPNQTRCTVKTADGTQFALPGTGLHSVTGTEEKQALYEGDDSLDELHAQNVTTNRTLAEYDGVFIRQTLCYVDDGNSFIFWERRRVMNRAYRVVNRSLIVTLNANVLTNPSTGTLAEIEAQQIERTVRSAITNGGLINDQGVNHVSGFDFQVSRVEKTAQTLTIVWALQIVPLAKVLTLTGDIGFTLTIDDTFSVGTA